MMHWQLLLTLGYISLFVIFFKIAIEALACKHDEFDSFICAIFNIIIRICFSLKDILSGHNLKCYFSNIQLPSDIYLTKEEKRIFFDISVKILLKRSNE